VRERVARLRRGRDRGRVIAEREDVAAASPQRAVEPLRGGDREALHAARERALVVGLDEQVQVIRLDADVDDAVVGAREAPRQRAADRAVRAELAEVADLARDAQDDVHGMPRRHLGARAMARIAAPARRLAPRPLRERALARAGAEVEAALVASQDAGDVAAL